MKYLTLGIIIPIFISTSGLISGAEVPTIYVDELAKLILVEGSAGVVRYANGAKEIEVSNGIAASEFKGIPVSGLWVEEGGVTLVRPHADNVKGIPKRFVLLPPTCSVPSIDKLGAATTLRECLDLMIPKGTISEDERSYFHRANGGLDSLDEFASIPFLASVGACYVDDDRLWFVRVWMSYLGDGRKPIMDVRFFNRKMEVYQSSFFYSVDAARKQLKSEK